MAFDGLRRVLAGVLLLALGMAPAGAARAETLAQTLVDAYEHSGLLDQNRALLRAADENVAQIVSELRPIITWSADITRDFGHAQSNGRRVGVNSTDLSAGYNLSLLLYDFGQTHYRLEAAKETVLATRELLRSIEQQVLLRAVRAYMNVLRTAELVSVRQNNLRLLTQELRAANDRFEVGEVTRTDVAQAEARLAAARSGLATAQGDLAQAIEEFRNVVGRKPGELRTPGSLPRLSGDIEGAKSVALRKHPDMLKAQRDVKAADLLILAAEAAMKPDVNLIGRLGVSEELGGGDTAGTGSLGVQIGGPIYRGGFLTSAKRQAIAQRDALRGALHVVRHDLAQDVGNAYAVLLSAQASRQAGDEQVRAARVAFRGVREEAKLGARTTLDVLDAEQELLNAQAALISADADVYIAAYTVLATIGELTAKDLRLDVQTYDPLAYYNLVKDAPVPISPQGEKLERVLRALGKN